jgi:hypothetical protein
VQTFTYEGLLLKVFADVTASSAYKLRGRRTPPTWIRIAAGNIARNVVAAPPV